MDPKLVELYERLKKKGLTPERERKILAELETVDAHDIPDAGKAGEVYCRSVIALLAKLDPQPTVSVLRLPTLGDGEDVFLTMTHVLRISQNLVNAPNCTSASG